MGPREMRGKPDIIRTIVLIFAVGLVITGFTSLQASEDKRSARDVPVTSFVQPASQGLNRFWKSWARPISLGAMPGRIRLKANVRS